MIRSSRAVVLVALLAVAGSASAYEARKVNVSTLNVRGGPGTGFSILGTADRGEAYAVKAKSGSWSQIWWAGNTGWVVTASTVTTAATGMKVTTGVLSVRASASTSATRVGYAYSGDIYVKIDAAGVWKKIWYKGKGRWVHGDYVKAVSLTPGTSPTIASQRYYPSSYELDVLNRTVMAEAGGEPYLGQVAVAAVVLNRVKSSQFPNTLLGVLTQPWQFTAVTTGMIWRMSPTAGVKRAVQEALRWSDPTQRALYYYAWRTIYPPSWTRTTTYTVTIGGHKFYR